MKRCAFLTMESLDGYVSDDALAAGPLEELGWSVEWVAWKSRVDWRVFDLVVVRSTWDYHHQLGAFVAALERIDGATRLENRIETLRWNTRKTYLEDLQQDGVAVIPTWRGERLDGDRLAELFDRLESDHLVIKPIVGANAVETHRLSRGEERARENAMARERILTAFRDRPVLAQPFMPGIVDEGEFSLIYFGGEFSHAILKTPKSGDFRVQEEHGGTIRRVVPEPELLDAGRSVIEWLPQEPLYARIDLVRAAPREFRVMEVELLEPSLYLRTDPQAPGRFAGAIAAVGARNR